MNTIYQAIIGIMLCIIAMCIIFMMGFKTKEKIPQSRSFIIRYRHYFDQNDFDSALSVVIFYFSSIYLSKIN